MTQNELTARWRALGYRRRMASETIVSPPPKQFLRVYHMMEAEWALVAIKRQRLKVSRFENLNDPFEPFALNRHTQAAREASKKFAADFNTTQGLLCFGADWSNSVMWSHYGEKHKGICLGFDVRRSLLQKIDYKDRRVRAALGSDPAAAILTPALQNQLACIKARAWEYEEEWRRFIDLASAVSEPPLHFVSFDADMQLKEVVLGERCLEELNGVRRLVAAKSPSAVVFKARLAYRSFRVVLNGYTRPPGSPTK
jgi:hypothetical protein